MSDYYENRCGKLTDRLDAANRKIGSLEMENALTLRRLADAWEKLGMHSGAKDARARADKMISKYTGRAA